jgi:hypothetical protein
MPYECKHQCKVFKLLWAYFSFHKKYQLFMLSGVIFHNVYYLIIYNVFCSSSKSGHLAATCVFITYLMRILLKKMHIQQGEYYCGHRPSFGLFPNTSLELDLFPFSG